MTDLGEHWEVNWGEHAAWIDSGADTVKAAKGNFQVSGLCDWMAIPSSKTEERNGNKLMRDDEFQFVFS